MTYILSSWNSFEGVWVRLNDVEAISATKALDSLETYVRRQSGRQGALIKVEVEGAPAIATYKLWTTTAGLVHERVTP